MKSNMTENQRVRHNGNVKKENSARLLVYGLTKRIFDLTSSFVCGICLIIPFVLIALFILIRSPGNPFYKQERVGKDGKTLYIYKFRSMKKDADNIEEMLTPEQLEKYRREYKLDDDPRLIGYRRKGDGSEGRCFGAKLRNTSVDELPQILFNICLLGNMSVVGPRPILAEELHRNYTAEEQALFLSVKPGLTGYWQAYGRSEVGYENHKRQDMELYYVRNRSLTFDIRILFKTVDSVLHGKGAK